MPSDLKDFWSRLQSGVEVAVASQSAEVLLGVRDGFLRYFERDLRAPVSVAVVPHPVDVRRSGLPTSDEEMMDSIAAGVDGLVREVGDSYHFFVGSDGGLDAVELDGKLLQFVRNWTLVRSRLGQAWGSSGSIQIPERVVDGLSGDPLRFGVPGTRRSGGLLSSLTGGAETRRSAVALATFNALSTHLYGLLEQRLRR